MKTKITIVAVIVLFIGYYIVVADTDELNYSGELGSSMASALVGIQNAIVSLAEPEEPEKEWYHGHFQIAPVQNDALFVVPVGRQFVLKRLYVYPYSDKGSTLWHLAANETSILDGSIINYSYTTNQGGMTYKYEHDFPDGCITVDANEVLNTVNDALTSLNVVVIGYFRDMPL